MRNMKKALNEIQRLPETVCRQELRNDRTMQLARQHVQAPKLSFWMHALEGLKPLLVHSKLAQLLMPYITEIESLVLMVENAV